jgi:hypothetical protein
VKEKLKKASEQNTVEKKKTQHPMMWIFSLIILVIIVVAFVIAPALGGRSGQSARLIFGYYNGEAIEFLPGSYFERQRDAYAEQLQNMGDQNSDNYQWQALQVWKGAYDATVVHTAILQQAERSGLHISGQELDRTIAKYGPYQKNGKFSAEVYRQTPNAEKVATRELFEENLIHERWVNDLMDIPSSSGEKKFFANLATPERQFQYVGYSLSDYPEVAVRSYVESKPDRFRRMKLSRISLTLDEKEARNIYSQLQETPDRFEELAQNHSSDENAEKGGDMGWVRYYELLQAFEESDKADMVFSLGRGEISDLIETSYGWVIYRCDEPAVAPDLENPEEIDAVRSYLIQNERGLVEDYFIDRAKTFIEAAKKSGFGIAARQNDLEAITTNYFPINYGGSFFLKTIESENGSALLSNAQSNERVLKDLFSLEEKGITEPFVLGNSIVVAQLLDEREAPEEELRQIESYFPYIVATFRNQEIRNHFLQSDKLEDNFMQVFARYFMN